MSDEILNFRKYWTEKEKITLQAMWEQGWTSSEIAKKLNRSVPSIERFISTLRGKNEISYKKQYNEIHYTDFLKLKGDSINVSDVHIPFWHRKLFDYLFKIAKKFKIKQLLINGDFLNLDSFSSWVTGFRGRENTEREWESASYVLLQALKIFNKIYITQGNHEDRLLKILQGQITAKRFFRMISDEVGKRIIVSDYPYCTLNNVWLIGHPKNYSDRGGQTPADLADKYEKNIITGHNHQFGLQFSKNGRWLGIDHGMGGDPTQIEYHQKSLTKNRSWQVGFSMIRNNFAYIFNLHTTDWAWWLK